MSVLGYPEPVGKELYKLCTYCPELEQVVLRKWLYVCMSASSSGVLVTEPILAKFIPNMYIASTYKRGKQFEAVRKLENQLRILVKIPEISVLNL